MKNQYRPNYIIFFPGCADYRLYYHSDPHRGGGGGHGVGGQGAAGAAGHPAGGHPGLRHRHLRGPQERLGAGQGVHWIQQLVCLSVICFLLSSTR